MRENICKQHIREGVKIEFLPKSHPDGQKIYEPMLNVTNH